jgi:CDP-diacylglycerol--glycerol-3-phosphate 3-phosphatidyltransferase
MVNAILSGDEPDVVGLGWKLVAMEWSGRAGLWLLWLAAALTLVTGVDYFQKSVPHLKDTP